MKVNYKEIDAQLLEKIRKMQAEIWSVGNRAAHGAGDRSVEYIGSKTEGNIVYDYYRDSVGVYWFGNRAVVDGEIVSMERYIFGRDIKPRFKRR